MPRTARQYLRAVLVKMGLFSETAFRYAIDKIDAEDIFLVSYPKSGNTWLRFLLAQALHPHEEVNFRTIDSFVPDLYLAPQKANALRPPRILKSHDAWFEKFPRTIYIVRDYRDVLVSYYHYQCALGAFSGNISEFSQHIDQLHPFGSWASHVSKAKEFAAKNPQRIIIVRYEDLLNNGAETWKRILDWSGIKTELSFEQLQQKTSFSALREKEKEHGSLFMDKSGQHFFREGKSGEWKNIIPAETLEQLLKQENISQLLIELGYPI